MNKKKIEVETQDVEERSSIILFIEWDGKTPPPTFYNRMHEYGLYSRRKRMQSPVEIEESGQSLYEWRASQTGKNKTQHVRGIVLQEGVIQCSTAEMARNIQQTAFKHGAINVMVGNYITTSLKMGEKDLAAFMANEKKVSKRGPKVKVEAGRYTVTCYAEGRTYEVLADSMPTECTECGSIRVSARIGKQVSFHNKFPIKDKLMLENLGDALKFWSATRFYNGVFEVPMFYSDKKHQMPPILQGIYSIPDGLWEFIDTLKECAGEGNVSQLLDDVGADMMQFLRLMDLAYCAAQRSKDTRQVDRIKQIGNYLQKDGAAYYDLTAPDSIDIVDIVSMDNDYYKYM